MRIVEEFAKVMGAILKLKSETRYAEAEQTVNEAMKQFAGMDTGQLLLLDSNALLSELTEKRKLSEEQLQAVAELLYQDGELKRIQGFEEDSAACFFRSWLIYKFLQQHQSQNFNMEILQRAGMLHRLLTEEFGITLPAE